MALLSLDHSGSIPAQIYRSLRLAGAALCCAGFGCSDANLDWATPAPKLLFADALPALPQDADAGMFAPSLMRLETSEADLPLLRDVASCGRCHSDIVRQWEDSAHAHASFNNPWYRANVDEFRQVQGNRASRFCGGCHDPLLLVANKLDGAVGSDDPDARAGITCMVCHGINEARKDGRASYTLSTAPVPLPEPGDAESLRAHRARVAPAVLHSPAFCGTCHRAFLDATTGNDHFLSGMDELGPHAASAYAGSHASRLDSAVAPADCAGCHMPRETTRRGGPFAREGSVPSHRMPGGQTALAAQRSPEQRDATEVMLRSALRVFVGAFWRDDGSIALLPNAAQVTSGESITIDLVLKNERTGHVFPGGVRDTQDTWVEVTVRDADGCLVAESGLNHASYAGALDPSAHVLATIFIDDEGTPVLTHRVDRFSALAYDHTISPRDARVVRYRWAAPEVDAGHWTLSARVLHRRHNSVFAVFSCDAERTARGQLFRRALHPIDGCLPQPITEVGRAELSLFIAPKTAASGTPEEAHRRSAESADAAPALPQDGWGALFDHALGLSHQLQEHLYEADSSLAAAFRLAPGASERAQVRWLEARLRAREGRLDEALALIDDAEALLTGRAAATPPHLAREDAALAFVRGEAYAQVWRFREAAEAFFVAQRRAPGDVSTYRNLARALGSTAHNKRAFTVARAGLALSPRDPQLLRSQGTALDRLRASTADGAQAAALAHREPDEESTLRLRCSQGVAGCQNALLPVPRFSLRARHDKVCDAP